MDIDCDDDKHGLDRNHPGRALDCWEQVTEFKTSVAKMEQVSCATMGESTTLTWISGGIHQHATVIQIHMIILVAICPELYTVLSEKKKV